MPPTNVILIIIPLQACCEVSGGQIWQSKFSAGGVTWMQPIPGLSGGAVPTGRSDMAPQKQELNIYEELPAGVCKGGVSPLFQVSSCLN